MSQSPDLSAKFRRELLERVVAQAAFDLANIYEEELEYALSEKIVTVQYLADYFKEELRKHV